jgi:hypothetical protein
LFLFAQANFDPIGRDGCSLDNVPDEAGGARAFCPGCGRVWLPSLDTYRTMCLAPQPDFRRVLEDVLAMQLAA